MSKGGLPTGRAGMVACVLIVLIGMTVPGTAFAAGDALQLAGRPQIDRAGILEPLSWTITETSAVFDQPGYRGDYSWKVPASIPPSGANVILTIKATDKSGGRFYPAMGLHTNLFIEGGQTQLNAAADKNAGKPIDEVTGTFKLVPGSYCDTCPVTVMIGIQSGPRITFTYNVVPKPKGKPCKAGAITRIAQFNGPLLCHVDEPAPGETGRVASPILEPKAKTLTVDVSSSAGNLNGTTIVGEADAKQARAEKIGEAVAACYLIGPAAFDYSSKAIDDALNSLIIDGTISLNYVDRPATRLRLCIALARRLAAPIGSAPSAHAAARGCGAKRIAIAPRVRKGKVVGLKAAKRQRPSGSSVRYSCTRSRTGVQIKVKRSQSLRAAIGKKLDLGIVRSPTAPASGATLSFHF